MMEKNNKYLSDVLMAIERQLVIIGEALSKLKKVDPTLTIENAHQIISFRNRLVHAYDGIDNSIVWAILEKHLGKLKKEVEVYLS